MALEINDVLIQQRAKSVKVFERQGRDVKDDSFENARHLGDARLDHSRLNLFSSLDRSDKEDNFKFRVPTPGTLRLGIWPDEGLRIEIMNERGKLIADSEGTTRYRDKYENIIKSKERIEAGEYYVRITRSEGTDATKEIGYSLQIQVGTAYRQDFDTTEYVADPNAPTKVYDPTKNAVNTARTSQSELLATMIGDGLNNLNSMIDRSKGIFATIMNRMFGG